MKILMVKPFFYHPYICWGAGTSEEKHRLEIFCIQKNSAHSIFAHRSHGFPWLRHAGQFHPKSPQLDPVASKGFRFQLVPKKINPLLDYWLLLLVHIRLRLLSHIFLVVNFEILNGISVGSGFMSRLWSISHRAGPCFSMFLQKSRLNPPINSPPFNFVVSKRSPLSTFTSIDWMCHIQHLTYSTSNI